MSKPQIQAPNTPAPPSSPGQQSINFDRASRERMLESAALPAVNVGQKNISPGMLFAVLWAINSFARHGGECFPAEKTIAAKARKSKRHTVRAIQALEKLDLLCVDNRYNARVNTTINHYQIVWERLFDYLPEAMRSDLRAHWTPRDQSAPGSDQSAPGSDQSAPGSDQSAPGAHKPPSEPWIEPRKNLLRGKPVDGDWRKAEEELFSFGVNAGHELTRRAKSAGHSAEDFLAAVVEAVATAKANPSRLNDPPRALYWFLETAISNRELKGRWPASGIVTKEETQRREDERRRVAAQQAQLRADLERAKLSAAERDRRLEEEWGPALDAFDRESLNAFAKAEYENDFLFDRFIDNCSRSPDKRPTSNVRRELLEFLSARRGAITPAEPVSELSE